MKKCNNCGYEGESNFCPECGNPMIEIEEKGESPNEFYLKDSNGKVFGGYSQEQIIEFIRSGNMPRSMLVRRGGTEYWKSIMDTGYARFFERDVQTNSNVRTNAKQSKPKHSKIPTVLKYVYIVFTSLAMLGSFSTGDIVAGIIYLLGIAYAVLLLVNIPNNPLKKLPRWVKVVIAFVIFIIGGAFVTPAEPIDNDVKKEVLEEVENEPEEELEEKKEDEEIELTVEHNEPEVVAKEDTEVPYIIGIPEKYVDSFSKALESIGFTPSQTSDFKQVDNWNNGERYTFMYQGEGRYIVYLLDTGEVSSIKDPNNEYIYQQEISASPSNPESILLVEGEKGEYGKEEDFDGYLEVRYYLPKGTYKVTCQTQGSGFMVETIETHLEDGYKTSDVIEYIKFDNTNQSKTVTIKDGECVFLTINSILEFVPVMESGENSSAYEEGKKKAEELTGKMEEIDWDENYKKAGDKGKEFAEFLNGLME